MKYLIIIASALMMSCGMPTEENSVKNPKEFTTAEILEMDRDTAILVRDGKNLYELEDELVVRRYELDSSWNGMIGLDLWLITCLVFFVFGGLISASTMD